VPDANATTASKKKAAAGAHVYACARNILLLVCVVAAVLLGGYAYMLSRADEVVRGYIEETLDQHYVLHGLRVKVGSARFVEGHGVELRNVQLSERFGPRSGELIADVGEVYLACPVRMREALDNPPPLKHVTIRRLKVYARLNEELQLNLERVLPLPESPHPQGSMHPGLTVEDAMMVLIDESVTPARHFEVRNINLKVTSAVAGQPAAGAGGDPTALTSAAAHESLLLTMHGASDHFQHIDVRGVYDPQSHEWSVSGMVRDLRLSRELYAALPTPCDKPLQNASLLQGRAWVGFRANGRGAAKPKYTAWGAMQDGSVVHPLLHRPVTNVSAAFTADEKALRVTRFTARCGVATLSATAIKQNNPAKTIQIQGSVNNLQFEDKLASILPPDLKRGYDKYSPTGSADVVFKLNYDGQKWQPDVEADVSGVSFAYVDFPYQIQRGNGKVVLRNNRVDGWLRCEAAGQPVLMQIAFVNPGAHAKGWLKIDVEGPLPVDEYMVSRFPALTQQRLRPLRPGGAITLSSRFWWETLSQPEAFYQAKVKLHNCSLRPVDFAYPVENIQGELELSNSGVVLKNVHGQNDAAYIEFKGGYRGDENKGRLDLRITANDVSLDNELRRALPPKAQSLWDDIRPAGSIDYVLIDVVHEKPAGTTNITARVEKWKKPAIRERDAISLQPRAMPVKVDEITGALDYRNGIVYLQNLSARRGDARVTFGGEWRAAGDRWILAVQQLAVDQLHIDRDIISAAPADIRPVLKNLELTGPLSIAGGFYVSSQEGALRPEAGWNLHIDIENGSMQTGASKLQGIHGGLQVAGQTTPDGFTCRGETSIDSIIAQNLQFTSVRGPFWCDQNRLLLGAWSTTKPGETAREMVAGLAGGKVKIAAEVLLQNHYPFKANSNIDGVDLAQLARVSLPVGPVAGKAYGTIELTGDQKGQHTLRGKGSVEVREAQLGEMPVVHELSQRIDGPKQSVFDTAQIDFLIQGAHTYIPRLDFTGNAITLRGRGEMNYRRELDIYFSTRVGRDNIYVPVITPVLGLASEQLFLIHLTGNINKPVVERLPLPAIGDTLNQLIPTMPAASPPRRAPVANSMGQASRQ